MLTTLDPQAALFLANVARVQQRIAEANNQVSSGSRINVASDAPDQIGILLQLRANLQRNTQITSNLTLAQADANSADNALSSSIQLMDSAVSLAAQGATATMDATGRASIAQQIQAIQQQMVANSQTSVQGRYIFSGDHAGSPSYTWDATAANPAVKVLTPQATRLVEDPAGGSFTASKAAQEIFDHQDSATNAPAADNVFNALNTLRLALQNNDTAGITNSMTLLKTASDHLNTMESYYGNVQNRIQNASQYASQYDVQLRTQISQTADTDVTSAALELTQANTQLQAAFQMRSQMPHTSLFTYMG